jgi:hypothetical protein
MKTKITLMIVLMTVFVFAGCSHSANSNEYSNVSSSPGLSSNADKSSPATSKTDGVPPEASIPINENTAPSVVQAAAVDIAGYGSVGALADKDLRLADMLTYAIQDEYLAHAEYLYIIQTYGDAKPFSNIVKAEENHISQLLPLFLAYGVDPPKDDGNDHTTAAANLTEAYQAGEAAEISNIAMYDIFLSRDLPDNVKTVFESLRSASENHLAAFRKHL